MTTKYRAVAIYPHLGWGSEEYGQEHTGPELAHDDARRCRDAIQADIDAETPSDADPEHDELPYVIVEKWENDGEGWEEIETYSCTHPNEEIEEEDNDQ